MYMHMWNAKDIYFFSNPSTHGVERNNPHIITSFPGLYENIINDRDQSVLDFLLRRER